MRRILSLILCLSLVVTLNCRCSPNGAAAVDVTRNSRVDSLAQRVYRYNANGLYDSLIISARNAFSRACSTGDSALALYSGSVTAQSFLFRSETDSIKYYIDLTSPYYEVRGYVGTARVIFNNTLASYYLRTDLDYSNALRYYLKGLEYAEHVSSIDNQIIILANITDIFYMTGDVRGRKYADRAYRLSMESVEAFSRCVASISEAQMMCLSSQYDSALIYIDRAVSLSSDGVNLEPLRTIIGTVRAEIADIRGELDAARIYYEQAIQFKSYTDPGTVSMTYLRYGEFLERNGMLQEALRQYREGLQVSYRSNNMKFRNQLMQSAAEVSYRLGYEKDALQYLLDDDGYVGKVSIKREQEFNRLLLSNQEMLYERTVMERELELQKANRKVLNAVFAVILILMFSILVVVLYVRQRRMYRKLVAQYQMFSSRLEHVDSIVSDARSDGADSSGRDDMLGELFLKLERAMKADKVFLQKNLTVDALAEHLATNRTYLSKAINSYSGMTFYRYLDMWRIKEAVRIISESSQKILLKQLSDDLGYSSPSVFYKAFKRETGCLPSQFMRESSTARADQSRQHS